ncbi:MurR/RpiR family transcriptional regulator [Vagococcus intermedius]|uniref:MurR/RpiR family transcriptional regulator n=1 Tax=Vagococcus intermedius TaxID=2991418 RepID=A0AAF0I843_9ENTE|nr:MurR/RpiR family transcriptional regulator [Vagococcus intermedius]WEG73980.1 MurR/RpiR family transcriptional regulator [Vagococcus intermedius]WEG76060.1 MurR/RpiR family transcriptional regulator [Vagococcus intermedius]
MERISYSDRYFNIKEALTKQEREAGEYILKHLGSIDQLSIQELSKKAYVSSATVTRLSRKLNYTNFSELKSYIREECAKERNSKKTLEPPIATYYKQMLRSVNTLVHRESLEQLVSLVKSARKLVLVGIGSSGLTATEAKLHLSRMGFLVDCISDPHMMKMSATLLTKADLIICISNSGETQAILETVKIAKGNGTTVVSLTNSSYSSLAKASDLNLATASIETIDDSRFINSQFTNIFILDCLFYELLETPIYADNRSKTLRVL